MAGKVTGDINQTGRSVGSREAGVAQGPALEHVRPAKESPVMEAD